MVNYKCPRCGYENNIKTKYLNHLKRKTICEPIISNCSLKEEYIKYNIIEKYFNKINNYQIGLNSAKNKSNISLNSAKCKSNISLNSVKTYKCKYCTKEYLHNQSLFKHLKTCKEKKNDDTNAIISV